MVLRPINLNKAEHLRACSGWSDRNSLLFGTEAFQSPAMRLLFMLLIINKKVLTYLYRAFNFLSL